MTVDNVIETLVSKGVKDWHEGLALIDKLFSVARPGAVFGEPVVTDEHTVITASEVMVGMGMGYGYGAGFGPNEETEKSAETEADQQAESQAASGTEEAEVETPEATAGGGGGGGGGGFSMSRPVAVISIGPRGVTVQPVVDATKVAIAFFTMFGTLIAMVSRMCQAGCGKGEAE